MRTVVRILWIPTLAVVLYTCWIFWQRSHETVTPPPKAARPNDNPLAKYGNDVKILEFYTGSAEIARGGKALICYGVVNAKAVRLEPPAADVWPSMSRCFEVTPVKTTRYTLTAEGADRQTVSESIEIVVKRGGA